MLTREIHFHHRCAGSLFHGLCFSSPQFLPQNTQGTGPGHAAVCRPLQPLAWQQKWPIDGEPEPLASGKVGEGGRNSEKQA